MRTQDRQIIDQIQKAKRVLVTFGERYTGDTLASALALYLFLQQTGKTVRICSAGFALPAEYGFLPGIKDIKSELKTGRNFVITLATGTTGVKEITYRKSGDRLDFFITPADGGGFRPEQVSSRISGHDFDAIIVVGTPDLESLGAVYEHNTDFFFAVPMINIDHHPDNEEYGQINNINITALATAEVVFDVLKNYGTDHLANDVATCLLTGIMVASKSFKVGSLTPRSLVAAGELMEFGADREGIVRQLYQSRNLNTLKLWGRVLAKLSSGANGKLIWSSLDKVDFAKTNTAPAALTDVVDELVASVPEANVIVIFSEDPANGQTRALLYTTKHISAAELGQPFGANGDKDHATITSDKPLAELEQTVIAHVKTRLEKLPV